MLYKITENQFEAYILFTRSKYANVLAREIDWFKNEDDTVFGLILFDNVDKDYTSMLLCRDENFRVRYNCSKIDFQSKSEAINWLADAEKELSEQSYFIEMRERYTNSKNKRNDIFNEIKDDSELDYYFKIIRDNKTHRSAKKLISEIMPHFYDVDNNFIQQFQTTGFDSRIWELYLFCYFAEEGIEVNRTYNAPDFNLSKDGYRVAVEAVTVGRKDESSSDSAEIELYEHLPIRFGSTLYSKMQHVNKENEHYWEYKHTKNNPFIIAIADFHEDMSMTWSSTALSTYLYGYKYDYDYDDSGKLIVIPQKVENHKYNGKNIKSGFFFKEGTEHISAILFSASGTVSKFNRIGMQCGFGGKDVIMIRDVMCYNPEENASKPLRLTYQVSEDNSEAWGEGITIFHNPNALIPLPLDYFESVTQEYFEDGYLKSYMPNPHVYNSITTILAIRDK